MKTVTFEELLNNYHFWKNGERDASKMDPAELVHSYLLEAEFLIGAIHFFRLCLQESQANSIPFADIESTFVQFLTVEELLVLCESVLQQKIKECDEVVNYFENESK